MMCTKNGAIFGPPCKLQLSTKITVKT